MVVLAVLFLAAAPAASAPCADGEALLRGEHWKRLRACAEERLQADGGDGEALYWRARVALVAGDIEAARAAADKAVAASPRRADVRYWAAVVSRRQADRASLLRRIGLLRCFKKEAEAALALDPAFLDARVGLIDFHLRTPFLLGGDAAVAERLAGEIARLDASRGWLARAQIARTHGATDGLEDLLRKAADADPASYSAFVELAAFYLADATRSAEAEDAARRALSLEPGRAEAYRLLAGLYARQKRWSDLDDLLLRLERLVPDDLRAYEFAASVLLQHTDELARAERYLRRYLSQEPEIGAPPVAVARFRLGRLLSQRGRTEEAIREFDTVLALDPGSKEAREELDRLAASRR